jgi:hypothetical protein
MTKANRISDIDFNQIQSCRARTMIHDDRLSAQQVAVQRRLTAGANAWLPDMPMIRDLPFGRWNRTSGQISIKRRRHDALALIAEESVRSYPSWISELSRESSDGVDRCLYAYEHLGAGEALALVRERTDPSSDHAVSYYHRAVHLGYVPKEHHWIAAALDKGLPLAAIVEKIKRGWIVRRNAKLVGTRIIVLHDGR